MSKIPQDLKELSEKISSFKNKNKKSDDKKQDNYSQLGQAFQIFTELVSGILVGTGIGYILDEVFDFRVIFLLIFIILGAIAGMLNIFRYLNKNEETKGE